MVGLEVVAEEREPEPPLPWNEPWHERVLQPSRPISGRTCRWKSGVSVTSSTANRSDAGRIRVRASTWARPRTDVAEAVARDKTMAVAATAARRVMAGSSPYHPLATSGWFPAPAGAWWRRACAGVGLRLRGRGFLPGLLGGLELHLVAVLNDLIVVGFGALEVFLDAFEAFLGHLALELQAEDFLVDLVLDRVAKLALEVGIRAGPAGEPGREQLDPRPGLPRVQAKLVALRVALLRSPSVRLTCASSRIAF